MRNTTRSLVLSCLFVLGSCFYSKAQWVSIPDTNFGTWLDTSGYSQCIQGNNTVGWQMDTTCNAVLNETVLNCNDAEISDLTGIQYFDNLYTLSCMGNYLSSLPSLPDSLTALNCHSNNLTALPVLPTSLITLDCSYNQLTALPTLPNTLTQLYCLHNQLSVLPTLPTSLSILHCYENQLVSLPALPNSLTSLNCPSNQLNSLPPLPSSLYLLNCWGNQLITLPALPSSLTFLSCADNQLTSLPALPNSLTTLMCNHNQLHSLPELPDSLNYFDCNYNLLLNCLPQLKKIKTFNFSNTAITCLPNYPQKNTSCNPPLDSIPLCNVFNNYGCPVFWNITGTAYRDASSNCVYSASDDKLKNLKVSFYQGGVQLEQVYTVDGGTYSFNTDTYATYHYSLDTANIPFVVTCPDIGYYTSSISATDSMDFSRDFGLECKPGFDLAAWSINGRFAPANLRPVYISVGDAANFYNAHCAAGISGSVTLTYNGPVQFVSAAPNALTPTVTGNTLTYTIADFGNVNFFTDFNIVMHTDTNAQIGQQVCFTLTVNPIAGDNNPANNVLTHCFTVVASYDPNDKTAYPAGNIDTAQKELTYTIRFQNTGTAEAQHIYITDTLDTDVDASTFQLLAYSHQPMVQLKENAVRFNFPNINLPDSNTNEPLSHGYVQYKVKLKPNLPLGTVINNTAYIYFDFNAPVVTNTTTNTISLSTGIASIGHPSSVIRLFPNPSNGNVTISVDERLIGSTAIVSDITGRVVSTVLLSTVNRQLSTNDFGSGVYFVTVGNRTQKLIITQ